jgi:hypothetical protein
MLKNLDENDILAKMFLLFMALYITVTGLYIVLTDDVKRESTTYTAMSTVASLNTWGIIFLIVGFLYFFMAFHEGKVKYLLMIVAGSTGAVIFGLYAMASIEMTAVIVVGARYAIISSFSLIIAVLGGISLWTLKK